MKGKCIFKVWYADEIWTVREVPAKEVESKVMFRIYCGRRWVNHDAYHFAKYAICVCFVYATRSIARTTTEVVS